jgi:hypothetical protein
VKRDVDGPAQDQAQTTSVILRGGRLLKLSAASAKSGCDLNRLAFSRRRAQIRLVLQLYTLPPPPANYPT